MNARTDDGLETTRLRIVNWARWARSRGGGKGACGSAEGRYRPEQLRAGEEESRRTPPTPIDNRDALYVLQKISPCNGFPARLYLALTAEYVFHLEPRSFQGYLRRHGCGGVPTQDLAALVADAVLAADRVLR